MADAKWISDLDGDMLACAAARRVLELRLGVVSERLPLAAQQADEDVEHVHQLRVGTRRAGAALRIFATLLPDKLSKRAKKALRRLRRAAGAARDWDVFRAMIATRLPPAPAKQRRGLDFLLGLAEGQRAVAQRDLAENAAHEEERLPTLIADLLTELDSAAGPTLHALAVPMLSQLVHDLEQAASADLQPYEHLHQVRIQGKKLRYAIEVFACCFGAEVRDRVYPAIVDMQEILGNANDSHVTVGRLTEIRSNLRRAQPVHWRQYQPGIEALLRFHQRRLPQLRRQFERWWQRWEKSGAERDFAELVAGSRRD